MPNISTRYLEPKRRLKSAGDHDTFLQRIKKTLYYGNLPVTDRLSLPVIELASGIFSEAQYGKSLQRLHCDTAAAISRNACVSPCSLVLAMIYLDRLKTCNPEYLEKVAPSELFLVSLMVSTKFLNDDGEENEVFLDEWAKSAGITVPEIIEMEKHFLNAIQWEIFVNEKMFWLRLNDLERTIALRQGKDRGGWFTYTDLNYLLNDIDLNQLIQSFMSATAVLAVSYAASVLTILGSVFVACQLINLPKNGLIQSPIESNDLLTQIIIDNSIKSIDEVRNSTLDPVKVLRTGIILASIKSQNEFGNLENTNDTTWDWWSNDLMTWLYENSFKGANVEVDFKMPKFDYGTRLDMSIANSKLLNLEDQIHKATSTRIQDQMESSWHIEWTDTIIKIIKPYRYYFTPIVSGL